MSRKKIKAAMCIVWLLTTIVIVGSVVPKIQNAIKSKMVENYDFNKSLVAHALGEIDGIKSTNSLQAFENSYNNGLRIFEVNLIETLDGHLVARHDWYEYLAIMLGQEYVGVQTLEQFKNAKVINDLTLLTFKDIVNLMVLHDDVILVLDTKGVTRDEVLSTYSKIIEEVQIRDKSALDRIIPQIYNREMYFTINELYDFKNIWYTLYRDSINDEELINFISEYEDIKAIVMSEARYNKELVDKLNNIGKYSFVHTINDLNKALEYVDSGITGIYTDSLTDIKKNSN